jgi:hypothetical protein
MRPLDFVTGLAVLVVALAAAAAHRAACWVTGVSD